MNYFYKESKSKKMLWFFLCVCGGGGGRGGEVAEGEERRPEEVICLNKRGEGGGVDGWTIKQALTNLPLQLLRSWRHNNALMYKLCP